MKLTTGKYGEEKAAVYLKDLGYQILERNYSCRYGEVDIIASNDTYILFVEVKTRVANPLVSGVHSVTKNKQARLASTASIYLQLTETNLQPRFDVIEVEFSKDSFKVTNHIENAF